MNDSYTVITAKRAKSLAEQTLSEIALDNEHQWQQLITSCRQRYDKWWRWLPWWKSPSDEHVKKWLLSYSITPIRNWRLQDACHDILRLVELVELDLHSDIYLSSSHATALLNR